VLVIIPTYEEAQNIGPLLNAVWRDNPDIHVLVVDDNSQDGTQDIVRQMQQNNPNQLHLLTRSGKLGLASAYLAGFRWALERNYQAVVEMDADFSHNPAVLTQMRQDLTQYDAVIGSRYVSGGGTENWNPVRKLISRAGSLYARLILGVPLHDLTGGYNAWHRRVLERLNLEAIRSDGYAFQIELKYRCFQAGFCMKETPILFSERREGQSKMSGRIVLEALYRVWGFRFQRPAEINSKLPNGADAH
jgi:dolichol-phosphate mannosyltransferase